MTTFLKSSLDPIQIIILDVSFKKIPCQELSKYYALTNNPNFHMVRYFKFYTQGCKNVTIESLIKVPKFSPKTPSYFEYIKNVQT